MLPLSLTLPTVARTLFLASSPQQISDETPRSLSNRRSQLLMETKTRHAITCLQPSGTLSWPVIDIPVGYTLLMTCNHDLMLLNIRRPSRGGDRLLLLPDSARDCRCSLHLRIASIELALRNSNITISGPEGYCRCLCIFLNRQSENCGTRTVIADSVNSVDLTRAAWRKGSPASRHSVCHRRS